jgi:hypothetical protein
MERWKIFRDLIKYLWGRKKFWLVPIIVVFVLMGIVLVFSESTVVGSFIYTLF